MAYQVVEIWLNGGREKVLVQDRVPLYYPNLLVTHKFRNRSPNTQDKVLRHIALFHGFLDSFSIDLISRLEQRPKAAYLKDSEISRFMVDAHLSKITLDKKYAGVSLLEKAYEFVGSVNRPQYSRHSPDSDSDAFRTRPVTGHRSCRVGALGYKTFQCN